MEPDRKSLLDKIAKEYDLRQKVLAGRDAMRKQHVNAIGFGANALASLQVGGGQTADRQLRAAEETAKNTKKIADQTKEGGITAS